MQRLSVLATLFSLLIVSAADGVLLDDFEDGNYTSNPTWSFAPYTSGSQVLVTDDPVRPGNHVHAYRGTVDGHRGLDTSVDMPWAGFDFTTEYMASSAADFNPRFNIDGDGQIRIELRNYHSMQFQITEAGVTHSVSLADIPDNDWWSIHVWHAQGAGLIRGEIHRVADNSLVASLSFEPLVDYVSHAPISHFRMVTQETQWQYVDNICLTPEPSTALLLVAGLFIVGRRHHVAG